MVVVAVVIMVLPETLITLEPMVDQAVVAQQAVAVLFREALEIPLLLHRLKETMGVPGQQITQQVVPVAAVAVHQLLGLMGQQVLETIEGVMVVLGLHHQLAVLVQLMLAEVAAAEIIIMELVE